MSKEVLYFFPGLILSLARTIHSDKHRGDSQAVKNFQVMIKCFYSRCDCFFWVWFVVYWNPDDVKALFSFGFKVIGSVLAIKHYTHIFLRLKKD